jgi:hypothetical protein
VFVSPRPAAPARLTARSRAAIIAGVALASPTAAAACALCHSPAALGLRHLFLHHDLGRNAAALAAPLPFLLAAILIAVREPRRRGQPHDR